MDTAKHTKQDRITIARVTGTASRRAIQLRDAKCTQAEAIAELHTITRDPHLLAHGVPNTGDWTHDMIRHLLLAAGADQHDIAANAEQLQARRGQGDNLSILADLLNAAPKR